MVLYRKLNVLSASLNKTFPSIHSSIYPSIFYPFTLYQWIVCLYQDFCCTLNVVFLFCFVFIVFCCFLCFCCLCFIFRFCACLLLFCCCRVVVVCFVYVGVFFGGGGGVKKTKKQQQQQQQQNQYTKSKTVAKFINCRRNPIASIQFAHTTLNSEIKAWNAFYRHSANGSLRGLSGTIL